MLNVRSTVTEYSIDVKNEKILTVVNESSMSHIVAIYLGDEVIRVDGRDLIKAVERCMDC